MGKAGIAQQAQEQALQLALYLKAELKGSGLTALAMSRWLGRAPQYLTRVFNGRVALKMKDAFGILQRLGESPQAFFERYYPDRARQRDGRTGPSDDARIDDGALPAGSRSAAIRELVDRLRAALRRCIVTAGTNQREVSRALGLPRNALGQALRSGTDLTAWHAFGVLIASKTAPSQFFSELTAAAWAGATQAAPPGAPAALLPDRRTETVETRYGDLVRFSPAEKVAWLADHPEGAALFTCRSLIEQSEASRASDAAAMLAAARAAVACAEAQPSSPGLDALTSDIRAESWASVANALRVSGKLRPAEKTWQCVELLLASGSGDPRLRAKLLSLKGSLRIEQRRHRQAIDLLGEARRLYVSIADHHNEARTLVTLSRAYWLADRVEEAIASVVRAAGSADGDKGPLLKLQAFHNLAAYLEEAGQPVVALAILERSEALYEENAGPLLKLRKRWVEGRLLARLGRLDEATAILDSVRRRFADLGMAFDAALAALDLAVFYAQLGKMHEVEQLATEMYPVFVSRDIPREATAALLLFAEAARAHTATVASITEVAERLKKIQSRKG